METKVDLGVRATPQRIEVAFPQAVSDVKLMAPHGKLKNRNIEDLGWRREEVDESTHVFRRAEDAKLELNPGEEQRLTVAFKLDGEAQREECFLEVQADAAESSRQDAGPDELEAEYGTWPPDLPDLDDEIQSPAFLLMEEDVAEEPDCLAPVEASVSERPSILMKLPVTVDKAQPVVSTLPDPASLGLQSQGWTVCRAGDQVLECIPPDDISEGLEGMHLSVQFTCGQVQYQQVVEAKLPQSIPDCDGQDYSPSGGSGTFARAAAPRPVGFPGRGGFPGGGGPWAGNPGRWPPQGQPNPWDVLAVPVPVSSSSGGNPGPGTSGGGLGDQVSGFFRSQMPGLSFRPSPAEFRESLSRLAPPVRNGGSGGSAYGGASSPPASGGGVATAIAPTASTSSGATAFGPVAPPVTASPQVPPAQLSGPFGALVSVADMLERQATSAAEAVQPIGPQADLDLVESHRSRVKQLLAQLIGEFRRDDWEGPRRIAALNEITRLQGHVTSFGQELGILPGRVGPQATPVTTQDHANISLFEVLRQAIAIADATLRNWNPAAGDPRPRMGELKTYLKTIAQLADRLRAQLEQFGLAPQRLSSTLTVGGALNWIQDEAGQQLQEALDTSGPPAGPDIQNALRNQFIVVRQMGGLPNFPWNHPMVARLVIDLDQYIRTAYQLAGTL
jgi:hypothetical protein